MNCPRCNSVVNPDSRFCGAFGFAVSAVSGVAPNAPIMPPGAFHFDTDGRGRGRGYTWEIGHQGAFALAVVKLETDQSINAEAGAMVRMSANIDLKSELKGGVFGALKRAVGGESAFVSTFTALGAPVRWRLQQECRVISPASKCRARPFSSSRAHILQATQASRSIPGLAAHARFSEVKDSSCSKSPALAYFWCPLSVRSIGKYSGQEIATSSIQGILWPGRATCNIIYAKLQKADFSAQC